MRRAKLVAALIGLSVLLSSGCNDTPKPTDKEKSNPPAKVPADNKGAKPAEGSGSN